MLLVVFLFTTFEKCKFYRNSQRIIEQGVFLSQFKNEEDVSKFLTTLHSRVRQMLEGEMEAHLGYEKHSVSGINTGNSRNSKYPKRFKPSMVNPV